MSDYIQSNDIYCVGERAGTLIYLGKERYRFCYAEDYRGPSIPGMPKEGSPFETDGLPPFFCNKLSEEIEAAIAPNNIITRLDLLNYFDILGSWWIKQKKLSPEKLEILKKLPSKINASIPGGQRKYIVSRDSEGNLIFPLSGSGDPDKPMGGWLAKCEYPPVTVEQRLRGERVFENVIEYEIVATEFLRFLLPDDRTHEIEIRREKGIDGHISLIKRFDIDEDGNLILFYEFGPLLGKGTDHKMNGSYKEMADYIRAHAVENPPDGIKTNIEDIDILFKRVLANMLVDNRDAHLKNFGLLWAGHEYRLAPNYDVVSYVTFKTKWAMALEIGGAHINDIRPVHIVRLAQDFGILSESPSPDQREKEEAHLLEMVADLSQRAEIIHTAVKDRNFSRCPELGALCLNPDLRNAVKNISKCMDGRSRGIFDNVRGYLNKQHKHETAKLETGGHKNRRRISPPPRSSRATSPLKPSSTAPTP